LQGEKIEGLQPHPPAILLGVKIKIMKLSNLIPLPLLKPLRADLSAHLPLSREEKRRGDLHQKVPLCEPHPALAGERDLG
jgi:hypothetical protein